jgi:hypothetical protein
MSNDPNLQFQQRRDQQDQHGGHGTLETYKLEKQNAGLPRWQRLVLIGIGVGVVLGLVAVFVL